MLNLFAVWFRIQKKVMSAKEVEEAQALEQELTDSRWNGREDQAESKASSTAETAQRDESKGVLTGAEVVEKVSEYFYMDEDLAACFESFVDENAHIFDLTSPEYKLDYTRVFNQYKDLFEEKIGGYIITGLGSSIEVFYEALESKTKEDANSTEAIFGQILASVTDFDVFATMLREAAQKAASKAVRA